MILYYADANSACNWGTWSTSIPKTQSSTTRDSRCCSIISFCRFSMICFLLCAICCLFHSSCNMICSVWRLLLLFFFGLCMLVVNCYLCFYFPTILKRTITFIQRRMLGAWNTNGPPSLLCLASREGTPSAASASIVWSLENVCKMTWKSYTELEYTGYINNHM